MFQIYYNYIVNMKEVTIGPFCFTIGSSHVRIHVFTNPLSSSAISIDQTMVNDVSYVMEIVFIKIKKMGQSRIKM